MKKISNLSVLFVSLLTVTPLSAATGNHWYVGMDAGWMQTATDKSIMTVSNGSNYPAPANVDQYSVTAPQPIMFDVQAGYRWYRDTKWIPSYALGLRYEHIFTKNVTGMVTQYSDPAFANYSYTWGINADVISLYSKFDFLQISRCMLYVDFGLGISFTQSHAYNETAFPSVIARTSPDYASSVNKQLAYNVGAGLDYVLSKDFLLSAGYTYQFFGNLVSGYGQGTNWGYEQLKPGMLTANMGLIGISYLVK